MVICIQVQSRENMSWKRCHGSWLPHRMLCWPLLHMVKQTSENERKIIVIIKTVCWQGGKGSVGIQSSWSPEELQCATKLVTMHYVKLGEKPDAVCYNNVRHCPFINPQLTTETYQGEDADFVTVIWKAVRISVFIARGLS